MKKGSLNRTRFVYKRCISLTKMASGVQNWRFVYKYAVFNLQTSISPYKLASRITTQQTFKVIAQKSDYDLYTSVNRVAKSDYGVESDYYTIRGQKRVKSPDNFPDLYKKYRKASKISNELHNRAIKRHLVSL